MQKHRKRVMANQRKPVWERDYLKLPEASAYFGFSTTWFRRYIAEHPDAGFVIWNWNSPIIKRSVFEKLIDEAERL